MSLDPSDYGWTVEVRGYEPVPTVDPMAPEELLRFTRPAIVLEIAATGGATARRMVSSVSQHAEVVKALHV